MLFNRIINYVYPKTCLVCGKKIKENSSYTCEKCSNILKYDLRNAICRHNSNMYFDKLVSCFSYEGLIRKRILQFKFKSKPYLGKIFGNILSDVLIKDKVIADVIIPVPIHLRRYLDRGYNQSTILAKIISKRLNIKSFSSVLVKVKNSAVQSTLSANMRKINVLNTYSIKHKDKILNKNILLIDDIYTTGATANECSRILKENGAKSIIVVTIAYGKFGKEELKNG